MFPWGLALSFPDALAPPKGTPTAARPEGLELDAPTSGTVHGSVQGLEGVQETTFWLSKLDGLLHTVGEASTFQTFSSPDAARRGEACWLEARA